MLHRAETNSQLANQGCLSQSSKVAPSIKDNIDTKIIREYKGPAPERKKIETQYAFNERTGQKPIFLHS